MFKVRLVFFRGGCYQVGNVGMFQIGKSMVPQFFFRYPKLCPNPADLNHRTLPFDKIL